MNEYVNIAATFTVSSNIQICLFIHFVVNLNDFCVDKQYLRQPKWNG